MAQTLAVELTLDELLVALTEDLLAFVSRMQRPRITDSEWATEVWENCHDLRQRVAQAREAMASRKRRLSDSLEEIANNLREYSRELSESPRVSRMRELNQRLSYNYEDLLAHLRKLKLRDFDVPGALSHIKPGNWDRSLVHVGLGLFGVLMYELVLIRGSALMVIGGMAGFAACLEVTRRIWPGWNHILVEKVFARISRPRELRGLTSSTWYTFALLLMVFLVPQPAVEAGVLVLAFADPAASTVGRRFGRRKLWGDRTAAGSLAFMATAFLVVIVFLLIAPYGLTALERLSLAATLAVAGAVAELVSDRVDDNFTIPVMCAAVASFWF
ncbi:MAG: hypothetical protein ISR64_02625 [Deltaproteobacteria bacterium]|nr:hypothetical protein [Deltaproteobacteria bacterium]